LAVEPDVGDFHRLRPQRQPENIDGAVLAADLYFLALCHHRLGHTALAGDCFLRAKTWHDRQAGRLSKEEAEELRAFRAEVETAINHSRGRR
jgi:hypothetical protein